MNAAPISLWVSFGLAFGGGLLGSLHCVGMCGAFASLQGLGSTGARPGGAGPAWSGMIAYQMGRLVTYLSLSVVAGLFGLALLQTGVWLKLQWATALVMALVLILVGLSFVLDRSFLAGSHRLQRLLGLIVQTARTGGPVGGPLLLGVSSTLLPCGFLYGFALASATTGSVQGATLTMLGFWLGTAPALIATGLLSRVAGQGIRILAYGKRALGVALIALGILGLSGRMPLFGHAHAHAQGTSSAGPAGSTQNRAAKTGAQGSSL